MPDKNPFSLRYWKQRFKSEGDTHAKLDHVSYKRGGSLPVDLERGQSVDRDGPSTIQRKSLSHSSRDSVKPNTNGKSHNTDQVPITIPVPNVFPSPSYPPQPIVQDASLVDAVQHLADTGVLAKVNAGPRTTRIEKALNKIDDAVATANAPQGTVSTAIQPAKAAFESSGAIQAIEAGPQSFMEDIPWLMKGLDEAARIHPVVTVVVLAFKAVYNMEMTRRENDKRIRALYVEMKNMIAVLVQLRDVKDLQHIGPDGQTIEARLQSLSEQTAGDIKSCANACDTYARKRLLIKILRGPSWETKLVEFIDAFTRRRSEFEQALAIHTAWGVDAIRSTVHVMKVTVDSIDEKLALFMKIFQNFVPQDELKLAEEVRKKGDIRSIQNSDSVLRELNEFENSIDPRGSKRALFTVKDLKEGLREDFNEAIEKNLVTFEGKYLLYQWQLREGFRSSFTKRIIVSWLL